MQLVKLQNSYTYEEKMSSRNIFVEDIAYGIYDRPGPMGTIADSEKEEEASTVPDDVPLSPSQHMSNQLSVQRPPIEDEEYVPASVEELSRAASAIAQLAPNETIEFFYRQLHKILDDATDKAAEEEVVGSLGGAPSEEDLAVHEEAIRRHIRKMLTEQLTPEEIQSYDEYRAVDNEPDEEPEDVYSQELSLDDLAQRFGYAGPPGVRQEIERLTNRLEYFATKVKEEDLDALLDYASGEFIDVVEEADLLDPEDIDDLRSASNLVRDLDSFRFFFVSAFVMPGYRQVVRDATKKVKTEISQMGIPKELHQTVFNQVTGASSRKPSVIKNKLHKLANSGKVKADDIEELALKIENARNALIAASDFSDDFIQKSLDKWQANGRAARVRILKKAMESTLEEL